MHVQNGAHLIRTVLSGASMHNNKPNIPTGSQEEGSYTPLAIRFNFSETLAYMYICDFISTSARITNVHYDGNV